MWPFRKRNGTWTRTTWVGEFLDKNGMRAGSIVLVENQPIQKDHRDLVQLTLTYTPIRPIPREDLDRFDEVQVRLDNVCTDLEFYQPAIVTVNGKREWLLYSKDGNSLMSQLVNELSGFEVQMECFQDPKWQAFRDLRRRLKKSPSPHK